MSVRLDKHLPAILIALIVTLAGCGATKRVPSAAPSGLSPTPADQALAASTEPATSSTIVVRRTAPPEVNGEEQKYWREGLRPADDGSVYFDVFTAKYVVGAPDDLQPVERIRVDGPWVLNPPRNYERPATKEVEGITNKCWVGHTVFIEADPIPGGSRVDIDIYANGKYKAVRSETPWPRNANEVRRAPYWKERFKPATQATGECRTRVLVPDSDAPWAYLNLDPLATYGYSAMEGLHQYVAVSHDDLTIMHGLMHIENTTRVPAEYCDRFPGISTRCGG